jgi:hypothetical protein
MTPFAAVLHHPTIEALAHARAPVASAVPMAISQHVARVNTLPCIGINLAWLACLAHEARRTFMLHDAAVTPSPSLVALALACPSDAPAVGIAGVHVITHCAAIADKHVRLTRVAAIFRHVQRTRDLLSLYQSNAAIRPSPSVVTLALACPWNAKAVGPARCCNVTRFDRTIRSAPSVVALALPGPSIAPSICVASRCRITNTATLVCVRVKLTLFATKWVRETRINGTKVHRTRRSLANQI